MKISYSEKQISASISAAEIMALLEEDTTFYLCHLIYPAIKNKVMEAEDTRLGIKNANQSVQYKYYDYHQFEVRHADMFAPYGHGNNLKFSYQVMNWIETNCGIRCRHLDSLTFANVTKLPGGEIFHDEELLSSDPREIRRVILEEMIRRNAPDLEIQFMNI